MGTQVCVCVVCVYIKNILRTLGLGGTIITLHKDQDFTVETLQSMSEDALPVGMGVHS